MPGVCETCGCRMIVIKYVKKNSCRWLKTRPWQLFFGVTVQHMLDKKGRELCQ
jgi:hypothetical protein